MERKVEKIWIDDRSVYIQTLNGDIFSESFDDYPRLRNATQEQRAAFEYNDVGIRWEDLDEDLCFDGFMSKNATKKDNYHINYNNYERH